MNDKSISQELINYRRYVLKTMWGGAMHWFAASRGDIEIDSHMPPRELQDARKMGEMYFDRFEKEAEKLLADLQSNGDIQISGPEESILKTRRKSGRHAIAINLAASPRFNLSDLVAMQGFIALYLIACLDPTNHNTRRVSGCDGTAP